MPDTLKDFLVGVGFKLDAQSAQRTNESIKAAEERITAKLKAEGGKRTAAVRAEMTARERARREAEQKQEARHKTVIGAAQSFALKMASFATKAAFAAEAATLAVFAGVDKAASGFDRLTYASRLAGASVANLTAFGYAAAQLGSSQAEADSALDAFGRRLRTNGSAYAKVIEGLGVKTRDAAGHLRDSAEIATDLGDALRRMEGKGRFGYTNAINQGAVFGFDENLVRALMSPDFRKREAQQKGDQARIGADPNAAARGGTAFEQSMRRLQVVLDAVGTKTNEVLLVKLKPLLDQLAAWFVANGGRIADIVARLADDLIRLASAVAQQLAGADWNAILNHIEEIAASLGSVLKHLSGEKSLVLLIGSFGLALAGLAALSLPSWLVALLGVGVGTVALGLGSTAAEAAQPSGGGGQGGATGGEGRGGVGGRMARGAERIVKAATKLSGLDGLRARGRKARQERHADAGPPADHAPDVAAPTPTTTVAPIPAAASTDGEYVFGDSIGAGLKGAAKALGVAVEGKNPKWVLAQIKATERAQLAKRQIILSTGASNDIGDVDRAGEQIDALIAKGVDPRNIRGVGVGDRPDLQRAHINERLAEIFRKRHATFTGPLDPENLQPDRIHPKNYQKALIRVRGSAPTDNSSLAATPKIPGLPPRIPVGPAPTDGGTRHLRPLGDTPALHQSMLHTLHGDTHIASGGTFYVRGGDPDANLQATRRMAEQHHRDLMRQVETAAG